eukprot:2921234-Pyramimonas_sp.AAC.3
MSSSSENVDVDVKTALEALKGSLEYWQVRRALKVQPNPVPPKSGFEFKTLTLLCIERSLRMYVTLGDTDNTAACTLACTY